MRRFHSKQVVPVCCESEILTVIHQLKEGRCPDLDKISPELLKLDRDESVEDLSCLYLEKGAHLRQLEEAAC